MIHPLFFAVLLQVGVPPRPVVVVRDIQRAIDRDGGDVLEAQWRARLARTPQSPDAMLAVATFERSRYRYVRADSLYSALLVLAEGSTLPYAALARQGMALWRSLGTDPARADSLFASVRDEARRAQIPSIEADAVLGLAQLRQRTLGPRVGRQLLGAWWSLLPNPTAADSALRLCSLGSLDEQLGDTTGIRLLRAGADIAGRIRSWRTAGNCRLLMAQSADRRGYREGAVDQARTAVRIFTRIRYELGIALASQWLGYLQLQMGSYAESRALLERAVVAANVTGFESVEAWARSGLAGLHLALGDPAAARAQAALASASHRRRNDRWGMATALEFEATAIEATGDLTTARARWTEAISAFAAAGIPMNGIAAYFAKARVEMRLNMLDSAERTLDAAQALGKTTEGSLREQPIHRAELAMRQGRLAAADSMIRRTSIAANWRAGRSELRDVMVALREARIALRAGRMGLADSAVAAATDGLERWRAAALNANHTSALAQLRQNWGGLSDLFPDVVDQLVRRGRLESAFDFVEHIRARDIVERRLQTVATWGDSAAARRLFSGRSGAPVTSLADVRRALGADEAFVSFTLGLDNDPSTALIVTRDAVRSASLPGRAALAPDIERFAQLAAAGTEATSPSQRLGASILAPVLAVMPTNIRRLMISPDQELHRLPFDALRLPDGRFVLEHITISIVPSATAALTLRAPVVSEGNVVLAIGDPQFARRPLSADVGAFAAGLQRLRHSGDEATRVALYGVQRRVLLGAAATEAAVRRTDWSRVAVAHFATHALVDAESQTRTALALSPSPGNDGFLVPAELATLQLRSPLVVLSACHSLGGQVLGGEGLRGLTAPLLEAGARVVVATHWSIGDRSVVPFIDHFYAAMSEGATVDDALRAAKLTAIRAGVSIADWAGFAVIGDGTMRPRLRASGRAPVAWRREPGRVKRDTTGR